MNTSRRNFSNQDDEAMAASDRLEHLINEIPELALARDYGVDIWMLLSNLDRPVIERIKRHQMALNTFRKMQSARKL